MASMAERAVEEAEQIPVELAEVLDAWEETLVRLQEELDALSVVPDDADEAVRRDRLVASAGARAALREHERSKPYVHSGSLGVSVMYLRDVLVAAAALEGEAKEQEHEFGDASYVVVRATKTGRVKITVGQREQHSSDRLNVGEWPVGAQDLQP